jgi:hypothetical protein
VLLLAQVLLAAGLGHLVVVALPLVLLAVVLLEEVDWQMHLVLLAQVLLVAGLGHLVVVAVSLVLPVHVLVHLVLIALVLLVIGPLLLVVLLGLANAPCQLFLPPCPAGSALVVLPLVAAAWVALGFVEDFAAASPMVTLVVPILAAVVEGAALLAVVAAPAQRQAAHVACCSVVLFACPAQFALAAGQTLLLGFVAAAVADALPVLAGMVGQALADAAGLLLKGLLVLAVAMLGLPQVTVLVCFLAAVAADPAVLF